MATLFLTVRALRDRGTRCHDRGSLSRRALKVLMKTLLDDEESPNETFCLNWGVKIEVSAKPLLERGTKPQ